MKVIMQKQTRYGEKARKYGETVEVEENIGERWIRKGIARPFDASTPSTPSTSSGSTSSGAAGSGDGAPDDGLDEMKFQELRKEAEKQGIKVTVGTTRNQLRQMMRKSDSRRGRAEGDHLHDE